MAEFNWWRSWHGAPMDPKWLVIAARANVKPGIVSAVAWELLDYASQNKDRGSVIGFDAETYAVYSGFEQGEIEDVISAMQDKGVIVDGRWANWGKRQPKREDDNSTERVRQWRDKKRIETQGNAEEQPETPREEKSREEKSREEKSREEVDDDSFPHPLSVAFEKASGITAYDPPKWIPAIKKMHELGITDSDIKIAIDELRRKSYNILGPWSVVNAAINVHGKRNGNQPEQVYRVIN